MASIENKNSFPQRALILQGGGALGAYTTGAFKALYKKLTEQDNKNPDRRGRPLFDIIAGTSSGAMNGAILVSHVIEKGMWEGSVEKLQAFWDYVSSDPDLRYWYPYIINKKEWVAYWENQRKTNPNIATGEAARRYYSTKQFLCSGVPHVYLPKFSTPCLLFNGLPPADERFFDNFGVLVNNTWYIYNNQPLKQSLNQFARFPIKTKYDENYSQPRLLLVAVDVQEGVAVTFDSYAKDKQNTNWKSEYGSVFYEDNDDNNANNQNKKTKEQYKYKISYPDGIILDYVMASGSVPINYQYTQIDNVDVFKSFDSQNNPVYEKNPRYFWDGGLLSNTPLRELIQAHKDYWYGIQGKGKAEENDQVPDLEVYIIDVWPTIEKDIPMDHDGAKDRKEDILLNDKTDSDEKNANIISDYISLVKQLVNLTNNDKEKEKTLKDILSTPIRSKHRWGGIRTYQDLIDGRFEVNVKRIERTRGVENDISNKMLDYSKDTVYQLIDDGYNDTLDMFELWEK
jgi:NTE family protein